MLEVHAILQRQRCNENITKKTGTLSDAYYYRIELEKMNVDLEVNINEDGIVIP